MKAKTIKELLTIIAKISSSFHIDDRLTDATLVFVVVRRLMYVKMKKGWCLLFYWRPGKLFQRCPGYLDYRQRKIIAQTTAFR